MSRITYGDSVVLGHKKSSNESDKFKKFSFFECKEVLSESEYLLHSKYDDSKVIAARYRTDNGKIELLNNSDHLKRQDRHEVMYSDTFDSEHRYFIFVDGKVDPRLTAVGPNKLHAEVYGKLDGNEKFVFNISSDSFLITKNNQFRPLTSKDSMKSFSMDRIPFAFCCTEEILTFDVDYIMQDLQVA